MIVKTKWYIYLTDEDLKDTAKDKDITMLSRYDFKRLSDDYSNKAYYIEYEGKKGSIVLKNKLTTIAGTINK